MKNLSEEQFLDLCVRLDKIGGAAYSGGQGDLSALSETMELVKQAYVDKPTSKEITKLTNQIHALANECAMHGWDYRPLLRANELLEQAYAAVPEPKKWVVNVNKKRGYDDQDNPVEWNTCILCPEPVSNFTPSEHEKIIEAPTLGSALDKMIATYCCSDDTEIEINAIAYFKLENQ